MTRDGVKRVLESNKREDRFNKRGRFNSCPHSKKKKNKPKSINGLVYLGHL